jgi:iron(III) transport system substrate-binding protein
MIVQGNQQVSDNIKRGERLIAVGALDSYAADERRAGHPIVTILPADGTFVIPAPTVVVKGSPNPNAAKLFAQFMISDPVQSLFPADGGYAARKDIPPPTDGVALDKIKIIPIDYDHVEKESTRIKKRFNELFQ